MNLNSQISNAWHKFSISLADVLVKKYNAKRYNTFSYSIINQDKRILINKETFFLFYSLIDRFLFELVGSKQRDFILDSILHNTAKEYIKMLNLKIDLDDFIEEVNIRQENWGKLKGLITEEGVGSIVYFFSQNVAEIACNNQTDISFLQVYEDVVPYCINTMALILNILKTFDVIEGYF